MKKLKVEGPASREAIGAAYRASSEKHARERLLAIRLGQEGKYTLQQIGDMLGRGRATIARWVQAYRAGGIEGLLERRPQGSAAGVSEELQQQLVSGLREGRWKGALKIRAWLQAQGVTLTRSGVYYWLRKLQASWKVPRKSHVKKSPVPKPLSKLRSSPA